jgi:hypothetical protein
MEKDMGVKESEGKNRIGNGKAGKLERTEGYAIGKRK